jgi:SNF2 family DNA or RNA helicase
MLNVYVVRVAKKSELYDLSFRYSQDLIEKIKKFKKSKYNGENKTWRVHCLDLYNIITQYKGVKDIFFSFKSFEDRNLFIKLKDLLQERENLANQKLENELRLQKEVFSVKDLNRDIDIQNYIKFLESGIIPYKYQCIGADFLLFLKNGLLGFEQGCGKTITSILACEMSNEINKVLVVVPNSLKFNYQNEIIKFTKHKKVHILNYKHNIYTVNEAKYIIINYNFFSKSKIEFNNYYKNNIIDKWPKFDCIILDESQYIKNEKANRTTNLLKFIKDWGFEYKFLLTGTPMPSRITELYTQMKLLSPSTIKNKKVFYEQFCGLGYNKEFGGYMPVTDLDLNIIHNKLNSIMFRIRKIDVLKDLPDLIINNVYIDLNEEQLRIYRNIEKGIKDINFNNTDNTSSRMHFLTILLKLRQYTSSLKVEYLNEIIENYNIENQKILVFDEFKHSLMQLYEKNKNNSRLFTGDADIISRQKYIDEFQQDNNDVMNLFITTPVGNAGITLTKSSNIFMITQNYVPSINEQCYARAHRIGQENKVFVYNILMRNTIDEHVNNILNSKKVVIKKVIDNEEYIDNNNNIDVISELMKIYK